MTRRPWNHDLPFDRAELAEHPDSGRIVATLEQLEEDLQDAWDEEREELEAKVSDAEKALNTAKEDHAALKRKLHRLLENLGEQIDESITDIQDMIEESE